MEDNEDPSSIPGWNFNCVPVVLISMLLPLVILSIRCRNDASDVDNPGDVRELERIFVIRIGRWDRREVIMRRRNWIDPSVNLSVDMMLFVQYVRCFAFSKFLR